jgi:nitrile hydratase alpha subunit
VSDTTHDHDHSRTFQPDIEDAAFSTHQVMAEAIERLLISKGVIDADSLRRQIEIQDSRTPAEGAALVAKAWVDEEFKQRLLQDLNQTAESVGVSAGDIPIKALENTAGLHNVVVCTLCSCYPRQLIGLPPDWYKSRAYRSRMVREPRAVLADFGTSVADDVELRVHDSTADLRFLVIPMRPCGTENMSEGDLANLVTRDCMIGVAVPSSSAPDGPSNGFSI